MNTMWKLFTGDIKRLTSNVVSIIIVIGLVMIPGLFTWFNVAACWDPFSNMKNLKFAVANVDEGYRSDLIPVKVTVGDQVVNALRANSQLDWTITSKADAVEGARSGKYYAAIVIPKSFSKDMMTFFSDDVQHAELTYYRNEKKNALAPNLLNEGTDEVAAEINTTFAKTITSAGLEIASSLADQLSKPEAKEQLNTFNANIANFATQLDDTADLLGTYSALTDTAGALLDTSNSLITQVSSAAKQGGKDLASAKQEVTDVAGALGTTADAMSSALDASASSFGAVSDSIDKLYSDANDGATTVADELDRQATAIGKQTEKYTEIRNTLAGILGNDSSIITAIDRSIARQNRLRQALNTAATDIRQGNQDAQDQHAQVKNLADQAQNSIANIKSDFSATVKPQIDSLSSTVADASGILSSGATQLDSTLGDLKGTSDDASDMLSDARTTLDKVSGKLRSAGAELASFNSTLSDALNSGDMGMVKAGQYVGRTGAAQAQGRIPGGEFRFVDGTVLHAAAAVGGRAADGGDAENHRVSPDAQSIGRSAAASALPWALRGVRADCAAAIHGVARWRFAVPARAGRASAAVYVVWMAGLAGVLVLHLYDGGEFRQCG